MLIRRSVLSVRWNQPVSYPQSRFINLLISNDRIDIDHEYFTSSSTTADDARIADPMGADWSYGSIDTFYDMMADPCLVNMDLETKSSFPQLDFNLPPFRKCTDNVENLFQISSPPSPHSRRSIHSTVSSRLSPPALASSPSRMDLALPTPQLPIWNAIPRDSHQLSVTQCIRQLSELSIGLFEHSNTIPPQSIHDLAPEDEMYQDTMNDRARDYSSYRVDDTFRLTQELIDLYPSSIYFSRDEVYLVRHSRPTFKNLSPIQMPMKTMEWNV
jgi:hypothetical protein